MVTCIFFNYLINNGSSYRCITLVISTSTGIDGLRLAHQFEHVDLVIFIVFFFPKQCLVENIQGKFQKNSSATFSSEESPSSCSDENVLERSVIFRTGGFDSLQLLC